MSAPSLESTRHRSRGFLFEEIFETPTKRHSSGMLESMIRKAKKYCENLGLGADEVMLEKMDCRQSPVAFRVKHPYLEAQAEYRKRRERPDSNLLRQVFLDSLSIKCGYVEPAFDLEKVKVEGSRRVD